MRKLYSLSMALLCCLFTTHLSAQTTFDNDSGDQDWFNAVNWDNGLPANGNPPTIPAGFTTNINPTTDYVFDFDVANMGTININLGNFNVNNGGAPPRTITNVGTININGGGTGIFTNVGDVVNTATGEINNDAVFINNAAGSIDNEGQIQNINFFSHFGSISSNGGEVMNASCAEFRANDVSMGSTMLSYTNNGITYILGNATLVVTTNNGVVLTDGTATSMPDAVCINMPLEIDLDANGIATITLDDIDDGSSADYCPIPADPQGRVLSQTDFNCAFIGDNTVTLTVFDGNGNSAQCMATVTVNDPSGPTITCPNNMNFTLAPGACEMTVNFPNPTVTDNCPGVTFLQTDVTGLSSGDEFPRGTTTLMFQATDSANNMTDCSFNITVNEFNPGTTAMVCDQSVQISLDANCVAVITPAAALEGNYGCYDDFTVNINSTGSDMANMSNLNQTVSIMVTNNISNNSCWGFGTVEEKLPPQIVMECRDTIVNCLQNTDPISEGGEITEPTFSDCSPFSVTYFDVETAGGCDDNFMKEITRTFTAVDVFGESNSCTQVITVEKISLANNPVTCPTDFEIECVVGGTPDFSPENTGYPTVNIGGIEYNITTDATQTCSVGANFMDSDPIDKCGAGYLIIRTWTIVDWCEDFGTATNPLQCFQQLKFVDHTDPIITQPADVTVSTNQTTCFSMMALPAIEVTDCSDFDVVINTPAGAINGNGGNIPFPGLAPGTYTITYIATDECSNSAQTSLQLTVIDDIKPQMVCDTYTTVSLDNTGFATAQANVFDDGSTDNCCILTMTARRMNDNCDMPNQLNFNSEITFCCADVGTNQMVEFRIDDCNGNFNSCMIEVEVQESNVPTITCPANITIECENDPNNLTVVGQVVTDAAMQTAIDGLAADICGNPTVTSADSGDLNCGTGTITRTYTATDTAGNMASCFHVITVENNDPFNENDIEWPENATFPSCDEVPSPTITGTPEVTVPNDCADIFIGYTDQVLNPISANFCRKILRTWTVTDWCQYVANSGNNIGRFTYEQTIYLEDSEGPEISGCEDVEICNFKSDCSEVGVVLAISITDNCTANSDLNISWIVDLNNDNVADSGNNTSGTGMNLDNEYPNGEHRITYTVEDHCGNETTCSFVFVIEDCKKPTPFCQGTNTTVMQGGSISIPITQFIDPNSFDNCTAFDDLEFSFSPNVADDVRLLDCDNLGENVFQIWITDEAGNNDFCEIIVDLQDNSGACNPAPLMVALGGQIAIEETTGVEDVMVEITSNSLMNQTNNDGDYMFNNLPGGDAYTVTPSMDSDPLNGVTTLDLVLLTKHILNVQPIESPYRLIAADANNSGSISTLDLLTIRKVILHIDPNFNNNTSWRFVDAAYEFPNPQNPFETAFPEQYFTSSLDNDDMQGNFVAIKIGDINESAIVSSLQSADDRTEETMTVTTEDQNFKIGELVSLDISSQTLKGMLGYQFTLNFDTDALEFVNVQPGKLGTADNLGLTLLNDGAITSAWDYLSTGHSENALTHNTKLFSLTFRAKTDGQLSDLIHLNSRFTLAESYTAAGTPQGVELVFTAPNGINVASESMKLYQNLPNPFRETTTIGFHLPEATTATLTILDVTGKTLKTVVADYQKGYHQIDISKSDLSEIGVLYYRLETPTQTATKKMLLLH